MNHLTVHLRVNDAATGKPTPCRMCIRDKEGRFYAPLGRSVEFPLGKNEAVGGQVLIGDRKWFYIDGACEITLPTQVPLSVALSKGFDESPIDTELTLGAGQMIVRYTFGHPQKVKRYLFVDTRAHFLSPHDALLEGQAEGLDSVQLLVSESMVPGQDGKLYPIASNLSAFSGQKPALSAAEADVRVNSFNLHPVLGKLALLHTHRTVFPLSFGGEEATDDWSLADWCDQGHRKGGLTIWVDALDEPIPGGEALVEVILGRIDAIEFTSSKRNNARFHLCCHLWNLGIPISVVGGSGKQSNRTALGAWRTVVRPTNDPTGWIDAIRTGGSYATNGPMLEMTGSSDQPWFQPRSGFDFLDAVHNGAVAHTHDLRTTGYGESPWPVIPDTATSGWVALRARNEDKTGAMPEPLFLLTSPFWLPSRNVPAEKRFAARNYLRPMVERTRDWVETVGRFQNPKRKQHLLDLCDQALKVLDEKAGGTA